MSDEIDEMEEKEGKNNSFKTLIIIIIIFQVLTTAGLVYFITSDTSANSGSVTQEIEEEADSGDEGESGAVPQKSGKKSAVKLTQEPIYHQTPSIISNLNKPLQFSYVSLKLSIRTYDQRIVDLLGKKELKVRSVVQSQVRTMSESELTTNQGLNDLTSKIQKKIGILLTEHDIDPKYIDDIFLADVIME